MDELIVCHVPWLLKMIIWFQKAASYNGLAEPIQKLSLSLQLVDFVKVIILTIDSFSISQILLSIKLVFEELLLFDLL